MEKETQNKNTLTKTDNNICPSNDDTVLLGMSGGVDSSAAAILLKEAGYNVYGITIRTWDSVTESCISKEKGCCTIDSIMEAKNLASKLGIQHQIIDAREDFKKIVVADFIHEYMNGRTPNPCVLCNPEIKWKILKKKADELGCRYIATGHYANVSFSDNRYYISKGTDDAKDQSYFLWKLSQNDLTRTIFPLGKTIKAASREKIKNFGFEKLSKKKESQEICFIPDDDYRVFLEKEIPDFTDKIKPGDVIDTSGKILGKHKGYPFYTVGQRKGLEIAVGYPLFVSEIIPETNTVVLAKKEELFRKELILSDCVFQKYPEIYDGMKAVVKIRFRNPGHNAEIHIFENKIKIIFDEPVAAITPGQSAVIYDGDDIIAGGIIEKSI